MKIMNLHYRGCPAKCTVVLGESRSNLLNYCTRTDPITIISDRNVIARYKNSFPENSEIIEIGIGETAKTLATVEKIYERFLELGLDRSSWVVGIGGGIVCDITGFAASTYLRGMNFGFVPTTLLAQVDASIGGKNGVNFKGYKNLIGVINQPKFTLCDFEFLKTLPKREFANGLAEIIKHSAIGNAKLFSYLEVHAENVLSLQPGALEKIIGESLALKMKIVRMDETERGERRKLNFGHTIGHAIEKVIGIPHGEAISIGMVAAAKLSALKGMISQKDVVRIENLLMKCGLPTKIKTKKAKIMDAIQKDKKCESECVHFVLLESIGNAKIVKMSFKDIRDVADDIY